MVKKRTRSISLKEQEIRAGIFLRERRKEKNYTQNEIARMINISRSNYVRKEKGQVPFTAGEFLYLSSLIESLPVKIKHQSITQIIQKI